MYVELRITLAPNTSPAEASRLATAISDKAMEQGAQTASARLVDGDALHVAFAEGENADDIQAVVDRIAPFTFEWAPGHNIMITPDIARQVLERALE